MTFVNTVVRTLMHPLGASSASTRTSSGLVRKLQQASDEYFGTQFVPKQNNWQRFVQKIVDTWRSFKHRIKMHFVKKEANKWLPALLGTGAAAGLAVHFRGPLTELAGKLLNKTPGEMGHFFDFAQQTAANAPQARSSSGMGSLLGRLANKFTIGGAVVGGGLFATYLARHKIADSATRITESVSRKFADGLINRSMEKMNDPETSKNLIDFISTLGTEAAKNIAGDPELKKKITVLATTAGTDAIKQIANNPELLKRLSSIPSELLEDLVHNPGVDFKVLNYLEGIQGTYKEKLLSTYKEPKTYGWKESLAYSKSLANLSEYNIPSQLGTMIPDPVLNGDIKNIKDYAERKHIFDLGMCFHSKDIKKIAQDYINKTPHDEVSAAELETLNEIIRTNRTEGRYETAKILYKFVKNPDGQEEFETWLNNQKRETLKELQENLLTNLQTVCTKQDTWRTETQAACQIANSELAFNKTSEAKKAGLAQLKTTLAQKDWPEESKKVFLSAYEKLAKANTEEKRKIALEKLNSSLKALDWNEATQQSVISNYERHEAETSTDTDKINALKDLRKAFKTDRNTDKIYNHMKENKDSQAAIHAYHAELNKLLPHQEEFLDAE